VKGDKFCNYCKKGNHYIIECYKLKNKEKQSSISKLRGKTKDEGKASVATKSGSEGDMLVAFAGCAKIDDEWILDSTYTFHICIHKEWFTTYDSIQGGGSVLMGDSTPRKIVGIGSIQIKMSDGVIKTLTNVMHIPTMTRNLISLSTLDLKGYKYSSGGGVMNVSIGSLVVLKSDLKSANLYLLRGTTIVGNVATISKSLSDSDATKLWHMRLGHMSELGLVELSKRGLLDGHNISK